MWVPPADQREGKVPGCYARTRVTEWHKHLGYSSGACRELDSCDNSPGSPPESWPKDGTGGVCGALCDPFKGICRDFDVVDGVTELIIYQIPMRRPW